MMRNPCRRTPLTDGHGGRLANSDEQVRDDLGPYGPLCPPLAPLLWRVDITIAHAQIYHCTSRSCLPDLALTHREVADFHGQPHANERLPKGSPVSCWCHA
jgi:hypothetical protein